VGILNKFIKSADQYFAGDNISLMTYVNLSPSSNEKIVEFKTVLQIFYERERNQDGPRMFYDDDCDTYKKVRGDGKYCNGILYDCFSMKGPNDQVKRVKWSKDITRIYDVYDGTQPFVEYQRGRLDMWNHVCRCICDQKRKNNTERYLYAGIVKAVQKNL
jgi:hypothetical protein